MQYTIEYILSLDAHGRAEHVTVDISYNTLVNRKSMYMALAYHLNMPAHICEHTYFIIRYTPLLLPNTFKEIPYSKNNLDNPLLNILANGVIAVGVAAIPFIVVTYVHYLCKFYDWL